jgi:hypothetical protein
MFDKVARKLYIRNVKVDEGYQNSLNLTKKGERKR